jgi:hypothetical protein
MPNTRLHDRAGRSQLSADQGLTAVQASAGIAEHPFLAGAGGADDLSSILGQFKEVHELGRPGIAIAISADLSAESVINVPAGKYWRIIGGFLQYTASADAATRTPIVTLEDDDDNIYETFTLSTKTANQVENDHFLAGSDGNIEGTQGVAAQGTLTIAEPVTDEDTFNVNGTVYTLLIAPEGITNAIGIGANEAATKANIEAQFVDGPDPDVNAIAFSGDDMVFTARNKGVAGDSIVFVEGTLTHNSNVLDGSGTLGGTTAGVDEADVIGSEDFPDAGALLGPGEEIALNVTNGHANDAAELAIFFIEFDHNPSL